MRRLILNSILLLACICAGAQDRDTVKVLFFGDVMSHIPQVTAAIRSGAEGNPDYRDYFSHIRPIMDDADYIVANMEAPFGVLPCSGYPMFSAPEALAAQTHSNGVDLFLSANNHICDKGMAGIDSTLAIFDRLGAAHTGVYRNETEELSDNPFITDINGIRTAFVNFTYDTNGIPVPKGRIVNLMDTVKVAAALKRAAERGAEIVVATPHWGIEYSLKPSREQEDWAIFLFRNGADVIVGTHPHVVQESRYAEERSVVFSLGNFASNMSVENSQIEMIYLMRMVRERTGQVTVLPPVCTYVWCAKPGTVEKNYTVIPIEKYLSMRDEFSNSPEFQKMEKEWNALKKKMKIK